MKIFDRDKLNEIWVTISRNKMRSILTGFGVFWGLFMLIILVTIGSGFRNGINHLVAGFSVNTCQFWTYKTSEAYKGYRAGRWWRMDNRDLVTIRNKATSVEYIVPMVFMRSDRGVVNGTKSGSYSAVGTTADFFNVQKCRILQGRVLRDADTEARRKVCVIGKEVYDRLFDPGEDAVGQYIKVNGVYFQVVGVAAPMGEASFGGVEDRVIMPMQTLQTVFGRGINFNNLICSTKKGYSSAFMQEEVSKIIKEAHDISPTDSKAVRGFNMEEEFNKIMNVVLGVGILTWIVGLGALFSGVIGISNIMLVSVRERMREIGVRRALGATPGKILGQIISESFVLTAIAGLVGFMLGMAVSILLEMATQSQDGGGGDGLPFLPSVSFGMAVGCLAILMVSGIIAGILPAYRALQVKAIDAIRDE